MSESGRSRSFSHTRTNSSSSGSSGGATPPSMEPGISYTLPHPPLFRSPGSRTDDSSDTSSLGSPGLGYSQYTPSEAAAQAALKNVKNVQITSTNRLRPLPEEVQIQPSNTSVLSSLSSPKLPGSSSGNGTAANKLSSVAASAAAFASRPKGNMFTRQKTKQHTPSGSGSGSSGNSAATGGMKLVGRGGGSSGSGFGLNKKKTVDLTIQTTIPMPSRPSISERSPLARPSKELERIASIGSLVTMAQEPEKHKHHISFRSRKDGHGGVLSSSSSNSKLISEQGSIYSFHPSSPGISTLEIKNLGTKEDQEHIAEGSWTLLCDRVAPLFSGEELRVPIEDLNSLVRMHLQLLVQQGGTAKDIVTEFKTFLRMGMFTMDISALGLEKVDLLVRLVDSWTFFFTKVIPYLEAVFLPLQVEFEGHGMVVPESVAQEFWGMLLEKDGDLNTRRFILTAYRDNIVLPIISHLEIALSHIYVDTGHELSGPDLALRVMQCANVLASIQSKDENQELINRLIKTLRTNWLSGSRTVKDRRGFVSQKPSAPLSLN